MWHSLLKRVTFFTQSFQSFNDAPSAGVTSDTSSQYLVTVPIQERHTFGSVAKLLLDAFSAFAGLLALSPLMIVIMVAIKVSSKGPIFFAQGRVGLGGRIFKCYKFRTMIVNAEEIKAMLADRNDNDGPAFKMKNDPRVTPVGRFLRKYSLDEIPQLFNVLKGDMSLVGPRPLPTNEVLQLEGWQLRRLSVLPGLTCIWQTSGRSNVLFEDWMRMDLDYIDAWNLKLDIRLILKTVKTILSADGAY